MRLDSLIHITKAVTAMLEGDRLVVFGSASLLASFPELGDLDGSPLLATYDADIVRPKVTETFPRSWEERLVPLTDLQSVFCLDPHDMAATKCLVGRAKDKGQINFLIEKGYIKTELLKQRVSEISLSSTLLEKAHSFIQTLG